MKYCEVAGEGVGCEELFTKVPTDTGMCCALNSKRALKKSRYTDLVSDMQKNKNYKDGDRVRKSISAGAGLENGIKLVLDLHSNFEDLGSVSRDFEAFRMYVGQPTEFPVLDHNYILVQPGHETFLSLSGEVHSASGIEDLTPEDRNCYFPHEGDLAFYNNYTYLNCRFACGILLAEAQVGCMPWYLPQRLNSLICDPWQTREFRKYLTQVFSNRMNCKNCLPDCETTEISSTIFNAKLRLDKKKVHYHELVQPSGDVTLVTSM